MSEHPHGTGTTWWQLTCAKTPDECSALAANGWEPFSASTPYVWFRKPSISKQGARFVPYREAV